MATKVITDPTPTRKLRAFRHAVVAYGWRGVEDKGTMVFRAAAQTKAAELEKLHYKVELLSLERKEQFVDFFRKRKKDEPPISEFHFFSHSGYEDGPVFLGGDFRVEDLYEVKFPKASWAKDAVLTLYGCNSIFGWFAAALANLQQVEVRGQVGFTSFSTTPDHYTMLGVKGMDAKPPLYQGAYLKGIFCAEIIYRKHGINGHDTELLEAQVNQISEALSHKQLPPLVSSMLWKNKWAVIDAKTKGLYWAAVEKHLHRWFSPAPFPPLSVRPPNAQALDAMTYWQSQPIDGVDELSDGAETLSEAARSVRDFFKSPPEAPLIKKTHGPV
jgi:hypothetical protein